ncbi:hypothetical protein COB57_05295 [Candidatus Peregrinibacteria bacterium]|nr:MAG: hypothetical protein COB57_05295 [Candidatus Peregrinibacteria bacterium]
MPAQSSVIGKKSQKAATQSFLPIAEIRDDCMILKNGGVRVVLKVSAVNFSLKSEQEQNALISGFQGFLNTIDFPIQISIKSKKLDIDGYLEGFKAIAKNHTNTLLKTVTEEYVTYVKKLVEYADIMEKQFYVVIPYDPIRAKSRGMWSVFFDAVTPRDDASKIRQRHLEFDSLKKALEPRISTVMTGLSSCGLMSEQLKTPDLIELYYQSFNPITSYYQKLENFDEESVLNLS